jgi:hypothetical protein
MPGADKAIERIRNGIAAVAIWSACAGVLFAAAVGFEWLRGEKKLDPPGWDCSWLDEVEHTGQCFPMKGWHFEPHPTLGKIAARDLTPTQAERDTDIDTANAWNDLTNDERREILAGRATIYDYFDFRSKSTSR